MPIISNRFRNKVLQKLYRPHKSKNVNPMKVLSDLEKAVDETVSTMFYKEKSEGKDADSNKNELDEG